jgi:hypothetical protein
VTILTPSSGLKGKPNKKPAIGRRLHKSPVCLDILFSFYIIIGWDGMDWIDLAQDSDRWGALVNTVMNLRVP